uniref:Longicornsin n=1 Tax=Rhipicephalus zambeziensis TaxID=60191 RepID=A0A224YCR3_9ACAR
MGGRVTTLCFLLLVAGWVTAVVSEEAHLRQRRDFGCGRGMVFACQRRCMRLYPGSTGYCQGFRCMCDTHVPVRPPFFMG